MLTTITTINMSCVSFKLLNNLSQLYRHLSARVYALTRIRSPNLTLLYITSTKHLQSSRIHTKFLCVKKFKKLQMYWDSRYNVPMPINEIRNCRSYTKMDRTLDDLKPKFVSLEENIKLEMLIGSAPAIFRYKYQYKILNIKMEREQLSRLLLRKKCDTFIYLRKMMHWKIVRFKFPIEVTHS